MNTRSTPRLVLLGIAAAALLAPASALAKVRCVPAQGPQCDASYATIGAAVTAAASADEILIGPGTHMASISTSKRLHFEGAGAQATTVEAPNGPALRLRGGGTIASLAVHGGSNGDDGSPAIRIDPAAVGKLAFHVVDVVARGGDEANPEGAPGGGLSVWGDFNERATVFVDGGTFRAGAGDGFYFSALGFGGTHVRAELDGVTAAGLEGTGIRAYYDAELEMTESVASGSAGMALEDGDYAVRRSRLSGSRCGLCASDLGGQISTILLENSLVTASAPAALDGASALSAVSSGPGGNVAVTARGSTLVAGGENPGAAVSVGDLSGVGTAAVELVGSIAQLQGPRAPGEADLVADREQITATRSSFTTRAISNGGSATEPGTAGNVSDAALGPDFSLLPGSPAIDSGDPALGGLDLAGAPRSQDGNGDGLAAPDMGAFELAPPGAGANARPVVRRFRIARKLLGPKHRRTRFRFELSEAARVKIRIERRVRGKGAMLHFKLVRTLKSSEAAGAQSVRFRTRGRPGHYRARIQATDVQRARSAKKGLRFRIAGAR